MDTPNIHPDTGPLSLDAHGINATVCRYCPATIGFVLTTASGTPMPLDWFPNPSGNVRIVYVDGSTTARALVVEQADFFAPTVDTRWMPHHATCPNAEQAKRAR